MSIYLDYLNGEGSLQHHGVLGMKWGIRRYQPYPKGRSGGREVGEAAKARRYKKELKKLNRYKDEANVDLQRAKAKKYASRSAALSRAAAVSGAIALRTARTGAFTDQIIGSKKLKVNGVSIKVNRSSPVIDAINSNIIARRAVAIGSTAAFAMLTGASVYNGLKSSAAHKYTTKEGHAKAEAKVREQTQKMLDMFGDLKIDDLKGDSK